ncbi:MAG: glutamate cyclase domain-containing protein [Betaproteobacteria bacterium]
MSTLNTEVKQVKEMYWFFNYLDQIANLEFKSKPVQQGGTQLRYEAGRAVQDNEPICGRIARAIERVVIESNGAVVLVTGTGNPVWLPKGETDGPSGVAILCRVFGSLGLRTCVMTEAPFVDAVKSSVLAAGNPLLEEDAWSQRHNAALVLSYPTGAERGNEFINEFFSKHSDVRSVFFIEKPGPNALGIFHNSSGKPKDTNWVAHAQQLANLARLKKILTVAVGDGGNEIGFGQLRKSLLLNHPFGADCGCPCKGGILNDTHVDFMFPASVSNWGAYAIAAALCISSKKSLEMPEWREVEASITAPIAAGAYDGYSGLALPSVDGVSLMGNKAVYDLMLEVVRIAKHTE